MTIYINLHFNLIIRMSFHWNIRLKDIVGNAEFLKRESNEIFYNKICNTFNCQ